MRGLGKGSDLMDSIRKVAKMQNSEVSKKKHRRSAMELMIEILKTGGTPSGIRYAVGLNGYQIHKYLSYLHQNALIEVNWENWGKTTEVQTRVRYKATEAGEKLIKLYENVKAILAQ